MIGFTVAAAVLRRRQVRGVAAADITLDGLAAYLSERKISPGTLSYMLDHQGRVIAASDLSKTSTTDHGRVELRHVSVAREPIAGDGLRARPRQGERRVPRSRGTARNMSQACRTWPPSSARRWQLFTVTPLVGFHRSPSRTTTTGCHFGLLAIALQIVIIYFLTGVISAPLEKLAVNVTKIQDLGRSNLPSVASPIREISVLSKAIDTLGRRGEVVLRPLCRSAWSGSS